MAEGVLIGAEAFLNKASGQDGRSAFDEISEAARSLRQLADNLDQQTASFAAGIRRFSADGLRTIEALTSSSENALKGASRTLRDVNRNPQSLIFGSKKTVPPYNGAR